MSTSEYSNMSIKKVKNMSTPEAQLTSMVLKLSDI